MLKTWALRLAKYSLRLGWLAVGLLLLYLSAALLGAIIPKNRNFVSAPSGVKIWVLCSDIHSDIIVPVKNDLFDWTTLVARGDAAEVDENHDLLAIGWGDRRFYLETPTWSDVKVANVFSAFCGLGQTAMHVDWIKGTPQAGPQCRSLTLTPHQYTDLCHFISASFTRGAEQRSIHIDAPGYSKTDAFYEAVGSYSALQTCNTWTGQALSIGGVRVGSWTPMKWGVLWQLPSP